MEGRVRLTPMEALTVLLMIRLCRENNEMSGFVNVETLAKALKRSKSRVRLLLNSLKSKGVVTDEYPMARPRGPIGHLGGEATTSRDVPEDVKGEIYKMLERPERGVEKWWTVVVDLDDTEAIREFVRSRPEFDRYFGLANVLRFLGIPDG